MSEWIPLENKEHWSLSKNIPKAGTRVLAIHRLSMTSPYTNEVVLSSPIIDIVRVEGNPDADKPFRPKLSMRIDNTEARCAKSVSHWMPLPELPEDMP